MLTPPGGPNLMTLRDMKRIMRWYDHGTKYHRSALMFSTGPRSKSKLSSKMDLLVGILSYRGSLQLRARQTRDGSLQVDGRARIKNTTMVRTRTTSHWVNQTRQAPVRKTHAPASHTPRYSSWASPRSCSLCSWLSKTGSGSVGFTERAN